MTLLEKVVEKKIALGCVDRFDALEDIKCSIDTSSLWQFAKMFDVLVNNSAEDFAMEFMSAFNKEVRCAY